MLLDTDALTVKDLTHGVFEIITKGPNPEVIIVDDPSRTIVLRPRGTSISVEIISNDSATMAQLQSLYKDVYDAFSQAQRRDSPTAAAAYREQLRVQRFLLVVSYASIAQLNDHVPHHNDFSHDGNR